LFWRLLSRDVLGDLEGTRSPKHSQLHENRLGRCILWWSFRIEELFNYDKRYLTLKTKSQIKIVNPQSKINMRWTIKPKPSEDKIKHLAQALHVERFCGYLLVQRRDWNFWRR
jgi:hypothetical protein